MKRAHTFWLALALILVPLATTSYGQKESIRLPNGVVILPNGIVGNQYNKVLRDELKNVRIGLSSEAETPTYIWKMVSGELPPGLTLNDDGTLFGKPSPNTAREQPYFFRVRVTDKASEGSTDADIGVEIGLMVVIKAPVVRLVELGSPRDTETNTPNPTATTTNNNNQDNGEEKNSLDALVNSFKTQLTQGDDEQKRISALQLSNLAQDVNKSRVKGDVITELLKTLKDGNSRVRTAARVALSNIAGVSTLTGVVVDLKGSPIPHVTITLMNQEGDRFFAVSDSNGEYEIGPLPYGNYTVNVAAKLTNDYKTYPPETFTLNGRSSKEYDITLEPAYDQIGASGESIRPILGFEQAGASASNSVRKFFMDLNISVPLFAKAAENKFYGPRWRLWVMLE